MAELNAVVADLAAEGAALDVLVADLPDDRWCADTAAAGWTIAHQIGHLAWTDRAALLSVTDPDGFTESLAAAWRNPTGFVDEAAEVESQRPVPELLADWRAGRVALVDALLALPAGTKLPWYGPPMSAMSLATARLMETWAHAQDVADALGAELVPTSRLRSIAHLGVGTARRRPTRHRISRRLLSARHPARTPRRPRTDCGRRGRRHLADHRPGLRRSVRCRP